MTGKVRLGVAGWPVAHSRSPSIQNAALRATALEGWRYQALPIPPELFADVVRALPDAGFRGLNVTIPHKSAALALATEASAAAREIGAANTLIFDGGIRAENTDAPALVAALPFSVQGRSAMVLGAGGSARAAVWALLGAGAAEVLVWNRTPERARSLCAEIGGTPVAAAVPADMLVNCTSVGLDAAHEPFKMLPLTADALDNYECLVDFVYSDEQTQLARATSARHLAVIEGLELLVAQGALSFELFTGAKPPLEAMRAASRGR